MKKNLLQIILILLIPSFLLSQQNDDQKVYNSLDNEISINIKSILSGFGGGGMQYRKRIGDIPDQPNNTAKSLLFEADIRGQLDSEHIVEYSDFNNSLPLSQVQSFLQISLLLGFEKQNQIAKFQFYYGLKSGVGILRQSNYLPFASIDNNVLMRYYTNTEKNSFLIAPYIGLKFFVSERISFSINTDFDFSYSAYEVTNSIETPEFQTFTEYEIRTYNRTAFNINFLDAINLNYYF